MNKQLSLFDYQKDYDITEDIFQAYFDARKNKRNTINALAFEKSFESNLFKLEEDILNRSYEPQKSICFIVHKPVKREIFAADFRDRVAHHFIYNYISPVFEKTFINDSYSCRVGKGTHYGIKRIDHFIRSCSQNYSKDCYILKLDIKGYFMAMNRNLLFEKVKSVLLANRHKINFDLSLLFFLIKKNNFQRPHKKLCCQRKRIRLGWPSQNQKSFLRLGKLRPAHRQLNFAAFWKCVFK